MEKRRRSTPVLLVVQTVRGMPSFASLLSGGLCVRRLRCAPARPGHGLTSLQVPPGYRVAFDCFALELFISISRIFTILQSDVTETLEHTDPLITLYVVLLWDPSQKYVSR